MAKEALVHGGEVDADLKLVGVRGDVDEDQDAAPLERGEGVVTFESCASTGQNWAARSTL